MKHGLKLFLLFSSLVFAQNNRIDTYSQIGWYNLFTTTKINEKFSFHGEYQWRRDELLTNWKQGLLRLGLNYQATSNVMFRFGYAWIETYSYGEIPINGLGFDFTEHRIFQMIQMSHREHKFDFSHRFMLEQRFVGRFNNATDTREDAFPLTHRARYMFRLQVPLKGISIDDKTPYIAFYDEVFINFGENVAANIFDQNRIGVVLGYRLNSNFRVEGGFLNQIVQFGRTINNRNVFQYNNGLIINTYLNF